MPQAGVTHDEAAHQFQVTEDSATAVLVYRRSGDVMTIVHTEVPEALGGRGIGGRLASAALAFAREQRLTVVPLCPFVSEYIRKHQEHLDLVRDDYRAQLTA